MMIRRILIGSTLLATALAGPVAMAQTVNLAPPPPVQPAAPAPQQTVIQQPAAPIDDRVAFNSTELWLIPRYFETIRDNQARASRSKKKQRSLPQGVDKAPAKGDVLPLSVVATLHRLPGPLIRDLPPERQDTDRLVVGSDVVMLRSSTGEVLDVLQNVIQ